MSIRSIVHNLKFNKWNLGFTEENLDEIIPTKSLNIHYMKGNNRKQWFADPFILDVTQDLIICLVEELSYSTKKGRIAKLEIDRNTYKLKKIKILLDLSTHLSFPFILRKDNKVYVMPENSASGFLTIYEYDPIKDNLIPLHQVSKLPLTDATVFMYDKKAYLCSTQKPFPNGHILKIYDFDLKNLTINDTPIQTVSFEVNNARNAGEVFEVLGNYYRPAQDCNGGYGKGVILQKLSKTANGFKYEDYCSFYPDSWIYNMGYHTFNSYKGVTVIDAHGYRYPIGGRVLEFGSKIIKYLFRIK